MFMNTTIDTIINTFLQSGIYPISIIVALLTASNNDVRTELFKYIEMQIDKKRIFSIIVQTHAICKNLNIFRDNNPGLLQNDLLIYGSPISYVYPLTSRDQQDETEIVLLKKVNELLENTVFAKK